MTPQPIVEAFDLIRQYAERQRWIPIGWREWHVGEWRIRVNGTPESHDGVPPWHALIEHDTIIAMMLIHPYHGCMLGWKETEDEFVAAMKAELSRGSA